MKELETVVDKIIEFSKGRFKDLLDKDIKRVKAIFDESEANLAALTKLYKKKEIDEGDLESEIKSESQAIKAKLLALEVENKVELQMFANDLKGIIKIAIKSLV